MFIQTISEEAAEGTLRGLYDKDQANFGFVPDHARVFSLRPDVLAAWREFQASIRKHMRLRRYELITLAAAQALNCRYCLLAHGAVLAGNGFSTDGLRAILTDFHDAGLEPAEVAAMGFAQKVALHSSEMSEADVEALRATGLTDDEILDITLATTMRCFASSTFNALGAGPDAATEDLERSLSDLLPGEDAAGSERPPG
jgi:uncharacterized peroxidase-related enzyme